MTPSTQAKWRERVRHARQAWEQTCFYAKRGQYRVSVSVRENGQIVATIEQCLPPVHAVEFIAGATWEPGTATAQEAMRWCERTVDERKAT